MEITVGMKGLGNDYAIILAALIYFIIATSILIIALVFKYRSKDNHALLKALRLSTTIGFAVVIMNTLLGIAKVFNAAAAIKGLTGYLFLLNRLHVYFMIDAFVIPLLILGWSGAIYLHSPNK